MLKTESTTFTKDALGRYFCNTFSEVKDSTNTALRADARPFDIIVIGGGSFGAAIAEQIFQLDEQAKRHRVLVLEGGAFLLPEHTQNLPNLGLNSAGASSIAQLITDDVNQGGTGKHPLPARNEVWGLPWHSSQKFPGLAYCLGGRSLYWGGWSPQLIASELTQWPADVVTDLQTTQFAKAKSQLGTDLTNDFIFGPLHQALKTRLAAGVQQSKITDALPVSSDEEFEAPLAVQSAPPRSGFFPFNKFSSVPLLLEAARKAYNESGGDDFKKRLMVVPNCHVIKMVRDGSRVSKIQTSLGDIAVQANASVIIALGTIESTRLALLSLPNPQGLMGRNLMAHLRSNLTIRIPRTAFGTLPNELQASALFLKGKHGNGHFHLQITAAGLGPNQANPEVELFRKMPDVDGLEAFKNLTDQHVLITLRGIGEMIGDKSAAALSKVLPDPDLDEFQTKRMIVNLKTTPTDDTLWEAMDAAADEVATVFANGQAFEILVGNTPLAVPAATPASQLATLLPHAQRRDGLGTTHHETGTLWMGTDPTQSVTDTIGRFHQTPNVYAAGPAIFPTIGSPNPMLTGIAMTRRTAAAIIQQATPVMQTGFASIFDGRSLSGWQMAGAGRFIVAGGTLETEGGLGLLWYTLQQFSDFILRLDWQATHADDNSGIFLRFPNPGNDPFVAVNQGYEIQIDDLGQPDGNPIHQTGAVYSFAAPNKIASRPVGEWNTYEIQVSGQQYKITLNGELVTSFTGNRGLQGHIGLQNHHPGARIAFRNLQVKAL